MAHRRRRYGRDTEAETLTRDKAIHLLFGMASLPGTGYATAEAMTDAWEAYRDTMMVHWLDCFAGSRPFAEWLTRLVPTYGERRIIALPPGATGTPETWAAAARKREHFGILHSHCFFVRGGELVEIQESETDFLRRVGLLTAEEEAAIAAGEGGGPFRYACSTVGFLDRLAEDFPELARGAAAAAD